MNRFRFLVPLLAIALALPAAPALAQSDGESRTMGDIIADGMMSAARAIGSQQDAISELAEGIDPSDPDAEVDPGPQLEPADPDPDDIDPSDPDSNPGESDPDAAPGGEPGDDEPEPADEIDVPAPAEPEEGGFVEIQLIPDPVPKAGRWKATNKAGTSVCTGKAGGRKTSFVQKIPRSTETGRLVVRDEGRTLIGRGLAEGQTAPLRLAWDPESERFKGSVRVAAPGGRTRIRFDFRVINQNRLEGELVADVRVNAQGVNATCTVARGVSLKRQ